MEILGSWYWDMRDGNPRWEFDIWAGKHTAYVQGFEFGVPYRFRRGDGAEVVGIITGFDWDEENKVKRLVVQPIEDRGQELAVLEVEKIRG